MTKIEIFTSLLEQHFHPHIVIPEIAKEIGLEQTIALQQIHYWLQKCGKQIDNNLWIYNTFEEWRKQFSYWSISKIKRVFYSLEEQGFIFSKKMNVNKSDHTKWYGINYPKLIKLLQQLIPLKKFAENQFELSLSKNEPSLIDNSNTSFQDNIFLSNETVSYVETRKSLERKIFIKKGKEKWSNNSNPTGTETGNRVLVSDINHNCHATVLNLNGKKVVTRASLAEEEKQICQNMVSIWNKVFINPKDKVAFTDSRALKLLKLWESTVSKDLAKWEDFCLKVNSSQFLMGEKKKGFKAYFDWLLNEITAQRVLAGEFGVGDRTPDIERESRQKKLAEAQRIFQERQEKQKKAQEAQEKTQKLAEELKKAAIRELKHKWGEEGERKAKESFEQYIRISNDDTLKSFYMKEQWDSYFVSLAYEDYIVEKHLGKTYADFRNLADYQVMREARA